MPAPRLSTLDASFLAVERPEAHMHVGWKSVMAPPESGPRPTFERLRDHIERRLAAGARYRQRLAEVPLNAHHPVWVDDPHFDVRRHVRLAPTGDLDELVADVMSEPLHRDRPLWEMWLCPELPDGRIGMVGKVHHCMVDGLGAVELTSLLLDLSPEPAPPFAGAPAPEPAPPASGLLAGALAERAADLAALPLRLVPTPGRVQSLARTAERTARAVLQAATPVAPHSLLNRGSSPYRHLAGRTRPLDDLKAARRAFGVSVNDALLAAVAGALREFTIERGETLQPLKAMVPVSVRRAGEELGNHISFVFVVLPCHEPDPMARLLDVAAQMRERKEAGVPQGAEAALQGAALAPRFVQQALAQIMASPRVFNLVVSNVPGPPVPLYLDGCLVEEVYPVVPLARDHALSVGMMSVTGKACFGLYADRRELPDVDRLAQLLDDAVDDLVDLSRAAGNGHGERPREPVGAGSS